MEMWWLVLLGTVEATQWSLGVGPSFETHFERELACLQQHVGHDVVSGLPVHEDCARSPTLWNATFECEDAACAKAFRAKVAGWTPSTMEWKAATLYGLMYYTTARVMGGPVDPVSLKGTVAPVVPYVDTCKSRQTVIWETSVSVSRAVSGTMEKMEETLRAMGGMVAQVWYPYLRSVDFFCTRDVQVNLFVMGFMMTVAMLVLAYVTCCYK